LRVEEGRSEILNVGLGKDVCVESTVKFFSSNVTVCLRNSKEEELSFSSAKELYEGKIEEGSLPGTILKAEEEKVETLKRGGVINEGDREVGRNDDEKEEAEEEEITDDEVCLIRGLTKNSSSSSYISDS
jgi:hypothetical protein